MSCADLVHTSVSHPLTTNPSVPPFPCPPSPFALPAPKLSREATATIPTLSSESRAGLGEPGRNSGFRARWGQFLGCWHFLCPCWPEPHPTVLLRGGCVPCPLLSVPEPGACCGCRSVDGQTEGWKGSSPSWCHWQSFPSPADTKKWSKAESSQRETSLWPWELQSLPGCGALLPCSFDS